MRKKDKAQNQITPAGANARKYVAKTSDFSLPADKDLRKKAEALLNSRMASLETMSNLDVRNLLHELQVHQIELEMQNEELRRTHQELEKSRSRYASLYDFAPIGYLTLNKRGIILGINLAGAVLLEKERINVTGKPFALFIHDDDRDAFYLHIKDVVESPRKCSCEIRLNSQCAPYKYVRLDSTVAQDKYDEYDLIRTTLSNITERKAADDSLQLSNNILEIANRQLDMSDMFKKFVKEIRDFTGCNAVGVRILDEDGNIPYQAYEGFSDKFYEKESNLSIKSDKCMCISIVRKETSPEKNYFTEGGSFFTNNTTLLLSATTEKEREKTRNACNYFGYESIALVPIRMGEEILGLIHVADHNENMLTPEIVKTLERVAIQLGITIARIHAEAELRKHREHLEELVEKRAGELRHTYKQLHDEVTAKLTYQAEAIRTAQLASLGELSAGVAHEINNPINGIINYAQMILNKGGPESKHHEIAARIIKEGDRIASIVNNLLSFARAGKAGGQVVHVKDILKDSLLLTKTYLKNDGIKLKIDIPETLPAIYAQPQQIEQVFLNIISNARYSLNLKYPGIQENKILEILCEEIKSRNSSHIIIIFLDHGTGISEDIRDKIMNPFFTTKPSGEGTGLGLSISYGIIADHGGRISLDSKEGEYMKVIIDLPAFSR